MKNKIVYLFLTLLSVNICAFGEKAETTFPCTYLNLSNKPWTIRIQLAQGMVDGSPGKTIALPPSQDGVTGVPVTVSMTLYKNPLLNDAYSYFSGFSGVIYIIDSNNTSSSEQPFTLTQFGYDMILGWQESEYGHPYIHHKVGNTGPVALNQPHLCSIIIPKDSTSWGGINYTDRDYP